MYQTSIQNSLKYNISLHRYLIEPFSFYAIKLGYLLCCSLSFKVISLLYKPYLKKPLPYFSSCQETCCVLPMAVLCPMKTCIRGSQHELFRGRAWCLPLSSAILITPAWSCNRLPVILLRLKIELEYSLTFVHPLHYLLSSTLGLLHKFFSDKVSWNFPLLLGNSLFLERLGNYYFI